MNVLQRTLKVIPLQQAHHRSQKSEGRPLWVAWAQGPAAGANGSWPESPDQGRGMKVTLQLLWRGLEARNSLASQ